MIRILPTSCRREMVPHLCAQDRTISGKVIAIDDNSALPSVNVFVEGTTQGTITDAGVVLD